jgi:hypothetical protein
MKQFRWMNLLKCKKRKSKESFYFIQNIYWCEKSIRLFQNNILILNEIISKYFEFPHKFKSSTTTKPIQTAANAETSSEQDLSEILRNLSLSKERTCICSDDAMMLHFNLIDPYATNLV